MKRLRAGLAATLIALSLSFGLAVQPAAALAPPTYATPANPGTVIGAVRVAGSAAVACYASVACGVVATGAAIAVGLYASRDWWIPTAARWFGAETDSYPSTAGGYTWLAHDGPIVDLSLRTMRWYAVDTRSSGSSSLYSTYARYACETVAGYITWAAYSKNTATGPGEIDSYVVTCPSGTVPYAFFTTPGGSYTNPGNMIAWSRDPAATAAGSTYRATAECVKSDGTTETLVVEYAGTADNGFVMPSCSAAGVGDHAASVDIAQRLPGRTVFEDVWGVTSDADPLYPDCDPTLGTGCTLSVYVDGAACLVGDARCLDWMSHSASRLECMWGPYSVPMVKCALLERAYQVGGTTLTDETTDYDPATGGSTSTDTQSDAWPTQVPVPPDGPPVPDPADPSVGETGCWPSGTAAWNPLEWVLRPVQCALVWAFVPQDGLDARTQALGDAWGASDVGQWVQDVGGVAGTVGTGVSGVSGCEGPVWNIALGGNDYRFAPLDACVAPMSNIAPWVKAGVGALVVLAGVRAVVRPITRALDLPSAPGV